MSKVYSTRLTDAEAQLFDAYLDRAGIAPALALAVAIEEYVSNRTDQLIPRTCSYCSLPLTAGDYTLRKGQHAFDSMHCFTQWLGNLLLELAGIHSADAPDFVIKWATILGITEYADLSREHFLCDQQHNVYPVTFFTRQGRVPTRCVLCGSNFQWSQGYLLVAGRAGRYFHLDCLLPNQAMLPNLQQAVALAIAEYQQALLEAFPKRDIPQFQLDPSTLQLGVNL